MSIRVQGLNSGSAVSQKNNQHSKNQNSSATGHVSQTQNQLISFQGSQSLRASALAFTSGNYNKLKVVEAKYVIDNILDADGTEINLGKDNKATTYSIVKDGNTTTIYKNWYEKGLQRNPQTGDEEEVKILKKQAIGNVLANEDFGKINDVQIGLEVQKGGKLAPVVVISQIKDGKKLSVKLEQPAKIKLIENETGLLAMVKIGASAIKNPEHTPSFSSNNKSLAFAGTPSLVAVQCKNPAATEEGIDNFINNTSNDLVSEETKGKFTDDKAVQSLTKNLTSILLAGGVGSRYIYANPNPEKINKPMSPVASQYNFLDLALAAMTNSGFIKLDELRDNKASVDIENGYGDYKVGDENSKLLLLKGSINQNTAGATAAAIKDNKIPADNHVFISMADHVHNIDFSRLAKAFNDDKSAGLVIIAQPMPPRATINKFGLIAVDEDSFSNAGLNFMPNIREFIEKPKQESLAAAEAIKTPISDEKVALASTGIYMIHKDVANILGKIIPAGQGMDFGGEFFPVMQKVLNPDKDSIFTGSSKESFNEILNKDGYEHTTELKKAFVALEIENKASANNINIDEANIRVLDELANPDSHLSNKLNYIDEVITKEDVEKLDGLKMKTWIAQDRDGKAAYWKDLGNMTDYVETQKEIKIKNIPNLPEKFVQESKSNTDLTSGIVCQSTEAKEKFVEFMNKYDIKTTNNGSIIVMLEDAE